MFYDGNYFQLFIVYCTMFYDGNYFLSIGNRIRDKLDALLVLQLHVVPESF